MNPLISIIVPCYNQAQYLPETLDSVMAQTYENWECVIVNDGSPDSTDEVATGYCARDPRFKYLKQENMGVSAARNNGIKLSHGEFILPLDGDDMIAPTYCAKAIRYFQEFPETKLVYCRAEFFGNRDEYWNLPEYKYEDFIWSNCIFNSAFYRRVDYDKTPGYNPNMVNGLEDWDFWLCFLGPSDKVYRIGEILFYYRQKDNSRNITAQNDTVLLKQQILSNHRELYDPFIKDIITIHARYKDLESICHNLNLQLQSCRQSDAYRIGKIIIKPFSIIKRIFCDK